jgi:hypothetical protein
MLPDLMTAFRVSLTMGQKTFALALVFGLITVPLACSGDNEDAVSGGGSAGKAGSSNNNAGSGGKAGNNSSGGTTPSGAGEGGTGNTGNTAGTTAAGTAGTGAVGGDGGDGGMAGGDMGGMAGMAGGDMGGMAGMAGEGSVTDPAAVRAALCLEVCDHTAQPDGPGGSAPPEQCMVNGAACTDNLCNLTGWSDACLAVADAYFPCILASDPTLLFCSGNDGSSVTTEGYITPDFAAFDHCPDTYNAYTNCAQNSGANP